VLKQSGRGRRGQPQCIRSRDIEVRPVSQEIQQNIAS
jgi:hypothetical protein